MLKFTTKQKGKIGVLIPSSKFLPSAADDFLNGIQLYLTLHAQDINEENCELLVEGIGNASATSTKEKAEKLLFAEKADVILAFVSFRVAEDLIPLFEGANKVLLVVNMGGHMPASHAEHPLVYNHTLHTWQHAFSFGQWAAKHMKGSAFIFTSLYDSGFDHSRAFHIGYLEAGGQVVATHITHVHQEKQPLEPYFEVTDWEALDWIYVNYLGEKTGQFLASIKRFKPDTQIALSPLALHGLKAESLKPWKTQLLSPSGWPIAHTSTHAQLFIEKVDEMLQTTTSPFHLLGYECGKLAAGLFQLAYLEQQGIEAQCAYLNGFTMDSPRGKIVMNPKRRFTEAALYVNTSQIEDGTIELLTSEALPPVDYQNEQLLALKDQQKSAWLHPYGF